MAQTGPDRLRKAPEHRPGATIQGGNSHGPGRSEKEQRAVERLGAVTEARRREVVLPNRRRRGDLHAAHADLAAPGSAGGGAAYTCALGSA